MVTLSDAVRKKESKISLELTNNIINVLQGVFGFEGKALEVWERETSTSLGGKLVASAEWNKGDYEGKFSEYTDQLLSAHILVVKGVINIPTKLKLWAQFNTWSNLRKAYSDVFIDTDPCEKDTIVDVFWTKDGQHLPIDFVSRMAGIRIFVDGKNRKAVAECNISPYVTHTNEFDVDGIVGIYSSKAKPYFLLKSIMNKLVKDSERGKNYQEKLDLINIERLSRKIYELGIVRNKFEVLDKRVVPIPIGSIFFKARDKQSFRTFVEDVKKQIIEPSVEPLDVERDILNKIEANLKKWNVKSLDEN